MGEDENRIREVLQGNREPYADLISPHLTLWIRMAYAWLGNQADAEDAVQNALIQCYQHLGQFRGESRFATWATRIVIRECQQLARHRSSAQIPLSSLEELNGIQAPGFEGLVTLQETIRGLLNDDEWALFQAAMVEGRSWQEISLRLGASEGRLKTRWWRIKKRLRQVLREGEGEHGPGL